MHKDTQMPKVSDMQPSKYLKASDADEDLVVTMRDIQEEQVGMGRDAEKKWVLYFEEVEKGLILNKTNMNTIAKLYGDDTDDWEGKRITLFSTEVQFQSEMVPAIRIRSKPPKTRNGKVEPARQTAPAGDGDDADAAPF